MCMFFQFYLKLKSRQTKTNQIQILFLVSCKNEMKFKLRSQKEIRLRKLY